MKKTNTLIMLSFFMILGAAPAMASYNNTYPKTNHLSWEEYRRHNYLLAPGVEAQNPALKDKNWTPSHWIDQYEDPAVLINGFFENDILRRQTMSGDVTKLIVGPTFYRLGGQDKRRVIATYDAVYGITQGKQEGAAKVIFLEDWLTRRAVGLYSAGGLQLE
jgi:hypothetical protein